MKTPHASKLVVPVVLAMVGAASVGKTLLPGWCLAGLDWTDFLYPFRQFSQDVFQAEGRLPFWNPFIFGGMPHLVSLNSLVLYPTELVSLPFALSPQAFYGLDAFLHLWIGACGIFAFLRFSGLSRGGSFTGALCYVIGGNVLTLVAAGHMHWLRSMAWLPWIILCIELGKRRDELRWYGLGGALLALPILTVSLVFVTFAIPVLGGLALFPRCGSVRSRLLGFLLLFSVPGLLGAVILLPGYEYYLLSVRNDPYLKYVAQWPLTFPDIFTLAIPDLLGGPGVYFGPHSFRSTTDYGGLLPLLMAVVGIAASWRENLRWVIVAGFAFLMASLPATPVGPALEAIPVYSGMRGSIRWLSFFHLAVCVFAAYGWDTVALDKGRWLRRGAVALAPLTLVLLVLSFRADSVANVLERTEFAQRHVTDRRVGAKEIREVVARALYRSTAVCGSAAVGVIVAPVLSVSAPLLAFLGWGHIIADNLSSSRPYFAYERTEPQSDEVVGALQSLEGDGPDWSRVATHEYFGLPNRRMSAGLHWMFGYHGLPLLGYIRLYVNTKAPYASMQESALRTLGVRYLVSSSPPPFSWPACAQVESPVGEKVSVFRDPVPGAPLHIPDSIKPCRDLLEVRDVLRSRNWSREMLPTDSLIPDALPLRQSAALGIEDLERARDSFGATVNLGQRALVVFSETWYPAWKAYIDGERTRVIRAYGALRALDIPAGKHSVSMVYDSWLFKFGLLISTCSVVGLVLGLLSCLVPGRGTRPDGEGP